MANTYLDYAGVVKLSQLYKSMFENRVADDEEVEEALAEIFG